MDGMYARIEETGLSAPRLSRPTTPERVAAAVVDAIENDAADTIVTPLPIRPLLALKEMMPGLLPHLHRWMGTTEFGRAVAERVSEDEPSFG